MKKILFSSTLLVVGVTAFAQFDANTAQDAVRYSVDNLTGTARFRAMGGAFGALGGDPSAININPAGSAIFSFNTGTITGSSYNLNNKANFFGKQNTKNDNSFDLNQVGGFFVFNNSNESAFMNKFTVGFNYENTQSFDNSIFMSGINPTGSITDYFLHYANGATLGGGVPLDEVQNNAFEYQSYIDQQATLGYYGFAINPLAEAGNNTSYVANLPANSSNHYQESYISNTGYNGKIALNFAGQFAQNLYVGANANIHFTDYISNTTFYESTNNNTGAGLQNLQFDNRKYSYGGGFSFNVGAIYKINEMVRLGAAYESPTWLRLQDEITQSVTSTADGQRHYAPDYVVTMVGGDYTIKTPSKYTGSAAFIFGRNGLLSIDYGVRNYANTKYTSNYYDGINRELSETLDWAGDLRVGTEWRVKMMSLRAGYRWQQSPYKNGNTLGDINSISGGLGFSFGGSRLDLSYTWQQRKSETSLFTPGLSSAAQVKTTGNNVSLSYTIDL